MRYLKAILSIYVGIYLVLPSCFCQVVSAFGGETVSHTPIVGSVNDDAPGPIPVCLSQEFPSPVCHCNEHEPKAAEAGTPDREDFLVVACNEPISLRTLPTRSDFRSALDPARASPAFPCWSLPPFSGVFLI